MAEESNQNPNNNEEIDENVRKIREQLKNLFGIIYHGRKKVLKLSMYYQRRRRDVAPQRRLIRNIIEESRKFAVDYYKLEEQYYEYVHLDQLQYEEELQKCNELFTKVLEFNLNITEQFNRDLQEIDEILQEMHDDKHLRNRRPF